MGAGFRWGQVLKVLCRVGSYMFTCASALAWHEEVYSAVEHYCGCEKQG
jgi:hypothetical protein